VADLRRALAQASFKRLDLGEEKGEDRSRSELERPLVNSPLAAYTVDFLWKEQLLVVETDGWTELENDPASVLTLLRRYLRRGELP
jgi:hypothetical protein